MCIQVQFAAAESLPAYDSTTATLRVPASLSTAHRVTLARAMLDELAIPQPKLGAVCWCGDSVDMTPRVPTQRRSGEVMPHGA